MLLLLNTSIMQNIYMFVIRKGRGNSILNGFHFIYMFEILLGCHSGHIGFRDLFNLISAIFINVKNS